MESKTVHRDFNDEARMTNDQAPMTKPTTVPRVVAVTDVAG
jgi:hypothetical protein